VRECEQNKCAILDKENGYCVRHTYQLIDKDSDEEEEEGAKEGPYKESDDGI